MQGVLCAPRGECATGTGARKDKEKGKSDEGKGKERRGKRKREKGRVDSSADWGWIAWIRRFLVGLVGKEVCCVQAGPIAARNSEVGRGRKGGRQKMGEGEEWQNEAKGWVATAVWPA